VGPCTLRPQASRPTLGSRQKNIFYETANIGGTLRLLCISPHFCGGAPVPRYLNKESSIDRNHMHHVFFGWIDLEPDAWALYGFASKTDRTNIIGSLNATFSRSLQVTYLPGQTITAAKDKADEMQRVTNSTSRFRTYESTTTTNTELATIPGRPCHDDEGHGKDYLKSALDEIGKKLQVEATGHAPGKRKNRQ
jgi:hypothetical protein